MRHHWLTALATLCVAGPASAATYTVAPTGNDGSNGVATPFRTLQRAVQSLRSGDTIVLQSGVYPGGVEVSDVNSITIRGVGDVALAGGDEDGLNVFRVNGFTLDGVKIRDCPRNGVYMEEVTNAGIRNSDFSSNGRTGFLTAYCSDVTVENCVASFNRDQHGLYFSNSGDRYRVLHNLLFNNGRAGIQINAVDDDDDDPSNPSRDRLSSDCLIEGNTIYGNNINESSAINLAGVVRSTIVNNLLYGNHGGGIAMWDDGFGSNYGCRDNKVLHNTIVFGPGEGRYGVSMIAGSNGNQLFDNVLCANDGPAIWTDGGTVQSNFNCLFASAGVNNSYSSLSSWRQATGNDQNSSTSSPNLQADYHPAAGSPAIDGGTVVYSVDKDNHPRPQGANPDCGCYEAGSAGSVGGGSGGSGGSGGGNTTPPAPTPEANYIYDDTVAQGWSYRSSKSAGDMANTSPVEQGARSISLTILRPNGYLDLTGAGIPLDGKSVLKLCLHGGTTGGQRLTVKARVNGAAQNSVKLTNYTALKANGWIEVAVPLADIRATSGTLTGLRIGSWLKQKLVYIDDIRVE